VRVAENMKHAEKKTEEVFDGMNATSIKLDLN
jgi:hypothetical protein